MKKKLIDGLTACGFVEGKTNFLQGTINPEATYPETFTTFWTNDTAEIVHYDNGAQAVAWYFGVNLYSSNPAIVNEKPKDIIATLRARGFIPQGRGRDIPSDEPTYTGWAMEFVYIEKL